MTELNAEAVVDSVGRVEKLPGLSPLTRPL